MSQEEIDRAAYRKAIKVIGGLKSQLTVASVTLEKVVNDRKVEPDDVSNVRAAVKMFNKMLAKIENQVDDLLGNDNFQQEELDTLTQYQLDAENLVEKVSTILDSTGETKSDTTVLDTSGIGEALAEGLSKINMRPSLNSADLPTFNGEASEYVPFIESFDFLVNVDSIPDSMKAMYLKRCIKEKGVDGKPNSAYDLIKHITPCAENYKIMRQKLEKRFKLSYLNRATYLTKLRKLSTWKMCNSGMEVRKLHDYVTENVDLLELCGGNSVNESEFLLSDILALIPKFMVNQFFEKNQTDRTLKELLKLIDVSVERMLERDALVPKTNGNNTNSNYRRGNSNPVRGNFNNNRPYQSYQMANIRQCLFCTGEHSSHTCNNGTVQDRINKAHQQSLCENCLRTGHYSKDCRYDSYCKCGGGGRAHCKALCFRNTQGYTAQPRNQQQSYARQTEPPQSTQTPTQSHNNNTNRGRGSSNNRGHRGRFQNNNRGASNNGYLSLPTDIDTSNNALADAECYMEIACGYVKSATTDEDVQVRFLFDSGSNASFGELEKIRELQCEKVGSRCVNVSTLGGNMVGGQDCDIVKFCVKDRKNFYPPTEICISVLDLGRRMVQNVQTWPLTEHQAKRVQNYELADGLQVSGRVLPIDILVGLDHYWKFMHRASVDPGFGPILRSSKLGWILSGQRDYTNPRLLTSFSHNPLSYNVQTVFTNSINLPTFMSQKLENENIFVTNKPLGDNLDNEVEYNATFSDLESFGIKPDLEVSPVLADFNDSVVLNEITNRYQVRLPIISKFLPKLEDGFQISKIRLDSLFAKMKKPEHAEFSEKYCDIIEEQEKLGVIERVPNTSLGSNACYLPHHGVFKKGADKLRVVYDGSYKTSTNNLNLNACLNPGPPLTNELIEMLMRFRTHDVVLIGDIEKAFLQIEVHEDDRDYLRFLWFSNDGELITYRFARVPFGLTSSSFLLNATLRHHMETKCLEQGNSELLKLLSKSHYVDDWILGAKSAAQVLQIKDWLIEFLEIIGMRLHKFNSNSAEVRQSINSECSEVESVLGMPWNVKTDMVSINIERALKGNSKVITKKELYSAPPRIFDPLGLLSPFMFKAKLLFQETCKLKLKWKEELPPDIQAKFTNWKDQWDKLKLICLPRQVILPTYDTIELHGFADASLLGYCACVYIVSHNNSVSISRLVISKTRLTPVKGMSIPRLELTAAYLLARVMALVIKFHDHISFNKLVYRSDSTTALHWIHSDHKQWTPYVSNRARDINLLSSPDSWKYVRTDLNPADLGTRGIDAEELVDNKLWFEGPDFLVSRQTDETDISSLDFTHPTEDSLKERRKVVNVTIMQIPLIEQILPVRKNGVARRLSDYSNLDKVCRFTSYILKFIQLKIGNDNYAKWVGYNASEENVSLTAEKLWVKAIQHDYFESEVKFCRDNPRVIPSGMKVVSSKVQQLGLFLDEEGFLRVNTLLKHAEVPGLAQPPMLIPKLKDSHFTQLVIWRVHVRLKHAGVERMLAELKQVYWVASGRQACRSVFRQCVKCRMQLASPYPTLAQPQLQDFRVKRVDVFTNTGVDFAGPLSISALSSIERKKRKQKKDQHNLANKKEGSMERQVFLIIFTCAVSRMVHSEVLDGMTVTDMMHGLRRFTSRYGPPSLFYSDNALTFKCVARELPLVFSHPNLQKFLIDSKITWKFYVEKAPWMGGFIERVVSLYKGPIARVMGRAKLDYQEFITLVCELNGMLNSRPISYVYDTPGEEGPITPSMLWCGKNITMFPPLYEARIDAKDPQICNKRLKYLDKILTNCWNRFSTEYISSLSERHLSRNLPRDGRQPKVGEVVLVKNDKLPRNKWKMVRISNITPGSDGVIRRVECQLPQSDTKNGPNVIYRPPRLLCPLECEIDSVTGEDV